MRPKQVKTAKVESVPCASFAQRPPKFSFTPGAFKPVIRAVVEEVPVEEVLESFEELNFQEREPSPDPCAPVAEDHVGQDVVPLSLPQESLEVTRPDPEWYLQPDLDSCGMVEQTLDLSRKVEHCSMELAKESKIWVSDHFLSSTHRRSISTLFGLSETSVHALFSPRALLACPCFVISNRMTKCLLDNVDSLFDSLQPHTCVKCELCASYAAATPVQRRTCPAQDSTCMRINRFGLAYDSKRNVPIGYVTLNILVKLPLPPRNDKNGRGNRRQRPPHPRRPKTSAPKDGKGVTGKTGRKKPAKVQ